ncbi:electron transfer flavoprotein [Salmonella enterica subsp. enterica serovar Newport]|nr:electron transfer flavoprotein [Salmonella enterica subsp. enterica serovar Newport]
MKIITCFKLVPEEQDITVTPEHSLNFDRAEAKISQFDLNAIEAAAQLAGDGDEIAAQLAGDGDEIAAQLAGDGDEIAALTVGGSLLQNSKVRKDVLSRGPDALFMVQDAQLEHALPKETALALASAAEKIGFDLLLFGEGSGDIYAQQVGLLTGELLKLPVINAVSHIQRDGDKIIVERTLEEDVEIIELTLPAVLCVTSDINVPRIPSMKAILGAGKKAVTSWLASDIHWTPTTPMAELVAISVPPQTERKHIILDNDSPEAITALADHLKKSLN